MRTVPASPGMARRATEAGRTQDDSDQDRCSAPALSATESRSDRRRPYGDQQRRRRLFRSQGLADGFVGAVQVSRMVLPPGNAAVVADHASSRVDDFRASLSDQPRGWFGEVTKMN